LIEPIDKSIEPIDKSIKHFIIDPRCVSLLLLACIKITASASIQSQWAAHIQETTCKKKHSLGWAFKFFDQIHRVWPESLLARARLASVSCTKDIKSTLRTSARIGISVDDDDDNYGSLRVRTTDPLNSRSNPSGDWGFWSVVSKKRPRGFKPPCKA
jgi:hypothetical protein